MEATPARKERLLTAAMVAAIFALAFALRVTLLLQYPHVVFLNEADAMGYLAIGRDIASSFTLGGATHFPPFYPFLCALFSFLIPDLETAGRVASSFMGALLVVPVFFAVAGIAGRKAGFLAALATAGCGLFVDFSLQPLSQMPYMACLLAATAFGSAAISSRSLPLQLALGISCACLYLTRPEGILAFFYLAALLLIARHFERSIPVKERLLSLATFAAGFAVPVVPYLFYLREKTGHWTISGKSAVTIIGVDASMKLLPDGTMLGQKAAASTGILSMLGNFDTFLATYRENAQKFLGLILHQIPFYWLVLSLAGLLLLVVSVVKVPKGERLVYALRVCALLTGVVVVLPVFAFSNISVGPSYVLPLYLLLIVGLSRLLVLEEPLFSALPLLSLPVILLYSYLSLASLCGELASDEFREYAANQEFLLKTTGNWLKENTPAGSSVMARWSQIGFYGERPWQPLADGSIPEVLAYLRKNRIGYLVIDTAAVPRRRPQLAPLLDPSAPAPGLRPLYAREGYGVGVIIYQVL